MSKITENQSAIYFAAVEKFESREYASCIEEFLNLSHQGDARATLYAATIFDRGGNGVDHDWVRARELYKQSLDQFYLPGAALGLALMIYQGRGGVQDYSEAARYFGTLRNNAFSKIMLGVMNLKGRGCLQNEGNALSYFDEAWKLGHPVGLKNAAIIRVHHGDYVRGIIDFLKSSFLIFWYYGFKRMPLIKSPRDPKITEL